ncbi:MAG: DUF4212 domain-containing protein [Caldimicrobium sp.]|nr:DUF4212 domain-containing protein [Caldimicrobium sp.]MCX7613763.1 DUF4212 domain-containing protein [Caldimicrobium sp.]MDW8182590.1 DUF4212 domain-containing protein [Caldimicrobium sp.]
MIQRDQLEQYWREARFLMVVVLFVWFLVSYFAAIISNSLNQIVVFGFPLGYYMGAQGSLVVFVLLILFYANKMDSIDEKYGVKEE